MSKRSQIVDGKRQAALPYLTGIACTPPTTAGESAVAEIRTHTALKAPYSLWETFVVEQESGLPDIKVGDTLVVGDAEYVAHAVTPWTRRRASFLRVLMEAT